MKTDIKKQDVQDKIDTHKESLTTLRNDVVELRNALMEREQQIIAISGAIEGLTELIPKDDES